jgi:TusA-related sulfurtransferase
MKYNLDVTKEHCPMTFVKVKVKLSQIAIGDILDVLLCNGEPLENVPRSAEEQGHRILETRKDGEHFHVMIEKRVEPPKEN